MLCEIYVREERVRFWFDFDIEFKFVKDIGVIVFRMGVDWLRIMFKELIGDFKEFVSFVFFFGFVFFCKIYVLKRYVKLGKYDLFWLLF